MIIRFLKKALLNKCNYLCLTQSIETLGNVVCSFFYFCSKKNRKNKKNGVEDTDGACASSGGTEIVPTQVPDIGTGNLNLRELKKHLDNMSKVKS